MKHTKRIVVLGLILALMLTYYVKPSSSSSYKGSSSYSGSSSSGSSGTTGAGGYDMPNSSYKSFSDYVKKESTTICIIP